MIHAEYLNEGAFRRAYHLLHEDGTSTGLVLKVDNRQDGQYRAEETFPRRYVPHLHSGCNDEVQAFFRIQQKAPSLLHHFARIYDHGPGWLIQEYIPHPCHNSSSLRAAVQAVQEQIGLRIIDCADNPNNYRARTPHGDPVAVDYALAYLR